MWGTDTSDKVLGALRCQRPSKALEEQQGRAVLKCLSADESLRECCEVQRTFDRAISRQVAAMSLPADAESRLLAPLPEGTLLAGGGQWYRQPAILSVILAMLVIFGFIGFRLVDNFEKFPGSNVAEKLLQSAEKLEGEEFAPFNGKAELLSDWFFLNDALEDYGVPPDLAALPAVGCRVINIEGQPVAQFAVEKPPMIISILHADEHGIQTGGDWKMLPHGEWNGAIRQDGNRVTLVALMGDESALQSFLNSLRK